MTKVAGERLSLRELTESDVTDFHLVYGDPEVVRQLSFTPRTQQQCADLVAGAIKDAAASPRSVYFLAAVENSSDEMVGVVRLGLTDDCSAEIGFALKASAWGQGLGRELADLALQLAFVELRLQTVTARRAPDNTSSERLLHKLGFTGEERLVDNIEKAGVKEDRIRTSIPAETWLEAHGLSTPQVAVRSSLTVRSL